MTSCTTFAQKQTPQKILCCIFVRLILRSTLYKRIMYCSFRSPVAHWRGHLSRLGRLRPPGLFSSVLTATSHVVSLLPTRQPSPLPRRISPAPARRPGVSPPRRVARAIHRRRARRGRPPRRRAREDGGVDLQLVERLLEVRRLAATRPRHHPHPDLPSPGHGDHLDDARRVLLRDRDFASFWTVVAIVPRPLFFYARLLGPTPRDREPLVRPLQQQLGGGMPLARHGVAPGGGRGGSRAVFWAVARDRVFARGCVGGVLRHPREPRVHRGEERSNRRGLAREHGPCVRGRGGRGDSLQSSACEVRGARAAWFLSALSAR